MAFDPAAKVECDPNPLEPRLLDHISFQRENKQCKTIKKHQVFKFDIQQFDINAKQSKPLGFSTFFFGSYALRLTLKQQPWWCQA